MNRREAIKVAAGAGALALIPGGAVGEITKGEDWEEEKLQHMQYYLDNPEWKIMLTSIGGLDDMEERFVVLKIVNQRTYRIVWVEAKYDTKYQLMKGSHWFADDYSHKSSWHSLTTRAKKDFEQFVKAADYLMVS